MKSEIEFFKPTKYKVYLTIIIFFLIVFFSFPAKENVLCKEGISCPPQDVTIQIYKIINVSIFVGINYLYLFLRLLLSYILACSIVNILNKK